jgi:hypothetical protein
VKGATLRVKNQLCGHLVLLFCAALAVGVLLAGCGDGNLGTSQGFANGIEEVTTLKSDYTFVQVFTDKAGRHLTNVGTWQQARPMGIPGVPTDGSYIEMTNNVEISELKSGIVPATAAELPHVDLMTSRSDFQPSQAARAQSKTTTAFWIIALQLIFLVFWVVEIVDVARRVYPTSGAKIGWVLVVVLLGCLGAIIYYFFGKSSGELPGPDTPDTLGRGQSG